MAVLALNSTQAGYFTSGPTNGQLVDPVDYVGKLEFLWFDFVNGAVAGDANSTVTLCYLPAGKIRVFGGLSIVQHSAFGASRVADVGLPAYTERDGTAVTANEDAFHSAADIATAGAFAPKDEMGADETLIVDSRAPVAVVLKCEAGTIPADAELHGFIVFARQ